MKINLHHINLATQNVSKMSDFYKKILFLDDVINDLPILEKSKGYAGNVNFVGDGNIQTHIAEQDLEVNFKTGQYINPVEKGHIAYRTDDLEAFKRHLETNNVKYADWKETAVSGWKQIFFYDPDGNIIEVHEKVEC